MRRRGLTIRRKGSIMETKKGEIVSTVRDRILRESIESLRREGLKFSVDTLADRLKISKKTVYKFFPDKEALALALYETYYADAKAQATALLDADGRDACTALLRLYFDAKVMARGEIFNKYKLNQTIYAYAVGQNDALWETITASFDGGRSDEDRRTFRIIVDGAFEKLCQTRLAPDAVIERLVQLV